MRIASHPHASRPSFMRMHAPWIACATSCHVECVLDLMSPPDVALLVAPTVSATTAVSHLIFTLPPLLRCCLGSLVDCGRSVAGVWRDWRVPPLVGSVLAGLLAHSSCCLACLSPRVTETLIATHLTARHLTDTFTASTHPTEAGARPLQTPTLVRLLFLPLIPCRHSVRGGAGG